LAASTSRKKEQLIFGIRIELLDLLSSIILCNGTINTAHVPLTQILGIILQDIKLGLELGEDQYFVAPLEQVRKEPIEK
jgi:hypothetical protein